MNFVKLIIVLIAISLMTFGVAFILSIITDAIYKHKQNKLYNPPKNTHYIEYNANPTSRRTGDCQIRAISKIFNISWEDAFDILGKLCKELGYFPSDFGVIETLFKNNGFESIKSYKGTTFGEFIKQNPHGTYALVSFSPGHMVAVISGKLYDTYDSSNFKIDVVLYKKQ